MALPEVGRNGHRVYGLNKEVLPSTYSTLWINAMGLIGVDIKGWFPLGEKSFVLGGNL